MNQAPALHNKTSDSPALHKPRMSLEEKKPSTEADHTSDRTSFSEFPQTEHKMSNPNPLSVILDEIESGFSSVRICKPPCCDCEIVLQGLALVKALRRAMPAIEQHGYLMRDITAILNQKQQDYGD